MTENALERGIFLNKEIKKSIRKKEDLEYLRNECTKNPLEEQYTCFFIEVRTADGEKMSADISSRCARAALDAEISILSEELEEMKKEFAELH